jgi:GTP-binding protein
MTGKKVNEQIRNIAIIAHVDHGKTTLVDAMFRQSGAFSRGQGTDERIMDSMDLERERGITIAAKNCSIEWRGVKINILDTPGHADFGGEVERALSMVDGAILLVDAAEGPLPQTRFVLSKALHAGLKLLVVINKIDRPDARPKEVLNEVLELLIDLDAHEDQLDFPLLYAVGKEGTVSAEADSPGENLIPLFDMIIDEVPGPSYFPQEPFQMLVSDLSHSDYIGRLAIGKVVNGSIKAKERLVCLGTDNRRTLLNVTRLQVYRGIGLAETDAAMPGDIIVLAGISDVHIGDTICTVDRPKALRRIVVDEPTIAMRFTANNSPFSGQEGTYVQSSRLRERLKRETLKNVSIQVEELEGAEGMLVKGRGEFQMVILMETLRREGYEFCAGQPEVIFHYVNGRKFEPIEHLYVDCDEQYTGIVTEKVLRRRGLMTAYTNHESGRARLEFSVPSRGLIGYRDEFLTDTRGTGIINSYVTGNEAFRGDFPLRQSGSLVADRQGEAVPYALYNLEPRGVLFVTPGERVYEGMIIGEHNRDNDLNVNPCKTKKLTNMRASGKDDAVVLTPVMPMTLERAVQFIREDELVEVTPKSIRLRKKILTAAARKSR